MNRDRAFDKRVGSLDESDLDLVDDYVSTPTAVNAHPRNKVVEPTVVEAATAAGFSDAAIARFRTRKTPPKKYADADRTVITPEYAIWKQAHRFSADQAAQATLLSHGDGPANHAMYYPEAHDKELGDGAWVFVIDPPITEQWSRFKVPLLSMWWARPHVLNDGKFGKRLPYQGVIQTPAGDLHLWPHEYTICRNPETFIGMEGVNLHALGGKPLLDPERLFYLQSRGISRNEATVLLFGEINEPNFAYVTFSREYVDMFAGVGTRPMSTVLADYRKGHIQ